MKNIRLESSLELAICSTPFLGGSARQQPSSSHFNFQPPLLGAQYGTTSTLEKGVLIGLLWLHHPHVHVAPIDHYCSPFSTTSFTAMDKIFMMLHIQSCREQSLMHQCKEVWIVLSCTNCDGCTSRDKMEPAASLLHHLSTPFYVIDECLAKDIGVTSSWKAAKASHDIVVLSERRSWNRTSSTVIFFKLIPEVWAGRKLLCGGGWHGSPFAQPPPPPPWSPCREGGLGWGCPSCRAGGGGGSDPNIHGSK